MPREQDQSGGEGSTNLQAGRDIVYTGMTAGEVRDIAIDVYNSNFLKLAGIAEDVACDRAERITRNYVETLQTTNPAGLASISDPDMLRTLYAAQEGYACSGEDDLEAALVDLLVDRAGQTDRGLKTQVLNQAVTTLPNLTRQQRAAVAVSFVVRNVRYVGSFDLNAFYSYLSSHIVPFIDDLPETSADFAYMQATNVGTSAPFQSLTLEAAYYTQAFGFFCSGFNRESAPNHWFPFLDDSEVFIPCLRNPDQLQINARSLGDVDALARDKDFPLLLVSMNTGRMQESEIKSDIVSHVPQMGKLFDKWGSGPAVGLSTFYLTAVGVAIGHACVRQAVGDVGPLEEFLI